MKSAGILTAGGDSPGLNAAIRAVCKGLLENHYSLTGFKDGFEGLAFDRAIKLTNHHCSGILTLGGTILRTSRHRPNRIPLGGKLTDMTGAIVENYKKHQLDCLVCIGGGGTHKSAMLLKEAGLNIITLPKTIDNDLAGTDSTIGFATALDMATGAIDNLHATASSHQRIMLVQIMGHKAGWLTLGSGLAGGADIILIPEIPYRFDKVVEALKIRAKGGKLFSIVPVAEGAFSCEENAKIEALQLERDKAESKKEKEKLKNKIDGFYADSAGRLFDLAGRLEKATGMETRVTILGYLQRGGTPCCADRILATTLGVECVNAILEQNFGVMIAMQDGKIKRVPLAEVVGIRKCLPLDHPWISGARTLGVSFGD